MEKNVVSIMVPCYNGELFLTGFFHTILQQTYKKIQVVFVDDGSEDKTREMAETYYPRFLKKGIQFNYLYQKNGGVASAINLALSYIIGEFCMWFDPDDYMSADHIEKKVTYLQEHLEYDVVMCRGTIYNEKDLNIPIGSLGEEKAVSTLFEDILLERRRCTPGLYMVRTEALIRALPDKHIYDVNRMGQNMQLLLPIVLHERVGYIEDRLFQYVVREDSLSHKNEKNIEKRLEFIDSVRDIKEHVLNELPISKTYSSFLRQKLSLLECLQKVSLLDRNMESETIESILLEYISIASIQKNKKKRNIIYWGKCRHTEKIAFYLEEYVGLHKVAFIDSDIEKCDNKNILPRESLSRERMYLIIPLEYHEEIIKILIEQGFENHKDFFYPKYDLREKFEGKKLL